MTEAIEEGQLPVTLEPVANPERVTANGLKAVTHLMKILDEKPDKVMINGKRHIEFDDWVLLGQFYGIDVDTGDEAEPVEVFGIKGFKAKAKVIDIKTGKKVGGASAYCMSNETNWKNKPFFQLASMAQTRAGSKALANILRGFVALKGISGTPAEEMMRNNNKQARTVNNKKPANARKPAPAQSDKPPAGINPDNVQYAEVTPKKQDWKTLAKQSPALKKVCDKISQGGFDLDENTIYVEAGSMNQRKEITDKEMDEIEVLLGKKA